jgi:hypothetical protein
LAAINVLHPLQRSAQLSFDMRGLLVETREILVRRSGGASRDGESLPGVLLRAGSPANGSIRIVVRAETGDPIRSCRKAIDPQSYESLHHSIHDVGIVRR